MIGFAKRHPGEIMLVSGVCLLASALCWDALIHQVIQDNNPGRLSGPVTASYQRVGVMELMSVGSLLGSALLLVCGTWVTWRRRRAARLPEK
ncbi:MAG: hypothetical protein HY290_18410 [Planctomycetia bacterium]|nr:hypothetical protein [Planctomycetia bacterium]